jgi:chromosome segregation ATPase
VQLIELQDNLTVLMDTKLNNSIPALDARLDALEVDLTEQELRLLSKIQDTYSKIAKNYGTRISGIQKSLEQLEKDTKDAISGVYEGLEDLAHSVSKHFSAIKESVSGAQRLSEDTLAQLTQLRTDNERWHLVINGSINTIEKHLAELDSDCDKTARDIIDIKAELKHMPTNSDLNSVLEKLESHLANHESIGLLLDITETDINDWRRASKAFLERFKNLLYVSDNAELCADVDLVDSVVLDCGTA